MTGNYQVINDAERINLNVLMLATKKKNNKEKTYASYNNNSIHLVPGNNSGKLLHGNYKSLYPNGDIKTIGQYSYGLKNGNWVNYYPNGNVQSSLKYKDSDTIKFALVYGLSETVADTIFTHKSILKLKKRTTKNKKCWLFSKCRKEKKSDDNSQPLDSIPKN